MEKIEKSRKSLRSPPSEFPSSAGGRPPIFLVVVVGTRDPLHRVPTCDGVTSEEEEE